MQRKALRSRKNVSDIYEEAVGSTGQSQGIYIQFLIAIINYISNMNTVSDGQPLGKTIFIDNPFGKGRLYKTGDLAKLLVQHCQNNNE